MVPSTKIDVSTSTLVYTKIDASTSTNMSEKIRVSNLKEPSKQHTPVLKEPSKKDIPNLIKPYKIDIPKLNELSSDTSSPRSRWVWGGENDNQIKSKTYSSAASNKNDQTSYNKQWTEPACNKPWNDPSYNKPFWSKY